MKRLVSLLATIGMVMTMMTAMPLNSSASGKGDFNNDGAINTSDVRDIVRMIAMDGAPSQKQVWWADYDQNSKVDTSDARTILAQAMVSSETINYATTTKRDWWGEKSIAILGDSISFGSGCTGNIADNSYAGIVKNAVKNANGGKMNYGFMPAYTTNWSPRSDEVCSWPTMTGGPGVTGNSEGWTETDSGDRLMYFGLTANKLWASLTYKLRSGYNFQYVCVYYQTGPNRGSFVVADNLETGGYDKAEVGQANPKVYDCENTVSETKRTGFFRMSDFTSGGVSINIVSNDNQPVTITGLGFYDDISGEMLTFNRYTRGGAMLTPLSDTVLSQAASSGTLIMGLGYNDFMWGYGKGYTKEQFSNRINYLIAACNKNGTNVIVNDYLWSNYKSVAPYAGGNNALRADIDEKYVFFRSELQRFARETGGIYVNQEAVHGQPIIDAANANDGVHPTNTGHNLMAGAIIEAMGLR